jgi:hypothetical protein
MPAMETEARGNQQGNRQNQGNQQGNQQNRGGGGAEMQQMDFQHVCDAALSSFRDYAKSQPETVALWCLGIGFVLGWKLKPW